MSVNHDRRGKERDAGRARVETHEVADVSPIRQRIGVPEALASCHSAFIRSYVIEGHVPTEDIKLLLRGKGEPKGLSVPGMMAGSRGMEQAALRTFAMIAFDACGSTVYERH